MPYVHPQVRATKFSLERTSVGELQLCSGCCRSLLRAELAQVATKQSMTAATASGMKVSCMSSSGRTHPTVLT